MADWTHLDNLIQGEVLRIKERRPPEDWDRCLKELLDFLDAQRQKVVIEKLRAAEELSPPDDT